MMDRETRRIIVALLYIIQFQHNPMDNMQEIVRAILIPKRFPFETEQTIQALDNYLAKPQKVSHLFPQPHSDKNIYLFLKKLRQELEF